MFFLLSQIFTNSATVAVLLLTSFILLLEILLYGTGFLAQKSVATTKKRISTNVVSYILVCDA